MQSDICMALLAAVGYYTAVRCEQFLYLLSQIHRAAKHYCYWMDFFIGSIIDRN